MHTINHTLKNNSEDPIDIRGVKFEITIIITSDEVISNAKMIYFITEEKDIKINVEFRSISFSNDLYLSVIVSNFNSVNFKDCIFENLHIDNYWHKQSIQFDYCIFENLNISKLDIEKLNLYNSFGKQIIINANNGVLIIHKLNLLYNFDNPTSLMKLFVNAIGKYSELNKFHCNIQIENNTTIEHLNIGNFCFKRESEGISKLFNISFLISTNFIENNISNLYIGFMSNINKLTLSGSFPVLAIDSISLNSFVVKNLKKSYASFSHIKPIGIDSKFCLYASDLKDCTFWNVDLNSFDSVELYNTRLTDAEFNLVSVPRRIVSNFSKDKNGIPVKKYDFEQEYYRQLYLLYTSSHDIENAHISRSKQLSAISGLNFKSFSITKYLYKFEKFVVFIFAKFSNNFGVSWLLSFLIWIILIPLLFYLWYLSILELHSFEGEINPKLAYKFFQFINPTHDTDFLMAKGYLDKIPKSYLIDFIARIVSGFGIYQFIAAFRRYGKN